jgi:hypothetical protein
MSQLRNDLLERIKDKHDLWFHDAMELYEMGRLRSHHCANDAITVMSYQIVWLLEYYDVDLEEFIKGLRQMMAHCREHRP